MVFSSFCKWTFLSLVSSGTVVVPFGIIIVDNISYELKRQHDNRFDMTSESWSYEKDKFVFGSVDEYKQANLILEFYETSDERYLIWDNDLIPFSDMETMDEIVSEFVLNNQVINTYITDTFVDNTATSPHSDEYTISTDVNFLAIVNDESFSITVTANNGGVVLQENTIDYTNQYSFNAKILLLSNVRFDLSLLEDKIFEDTCINFTAKNPRNIKASELNLYESYIYDGDNQLDVLKENIITYVYEISKIQITVSDFEIKLDTTQITNRDFSFKNIVPFSISATVDSVYAYNSGIIATYAQAIYGLPSIKSLDGTDMGKDSIYVIDPTALTNAEFDSIANNATLNNVVLDAIKSDVDPDVTDADFNITLLDASVTLAGRNYSQWVDLEYRITANSEFGHIQDEANIKYRIVALKQTATVSTKFSANLNWSDTLWHEGTKVLIVWVASYGNWIFQINGVQIDFSYNEVLLPLLNLDQQYTVADAVSRGFFVGGTTPTMNTTDGSCIRLGSNDYTGTDFPDASWLGIVDAAIVTLDTCRPRGYNETWDTNNDWIPLGSKSHDFHLRLANFWQNVRLVKKVDPATNKEYVQAVINGAINWSFARDSRWKEDVGSNYSNRSKGSGSFTTAFSENIIERNSPWDNIA